MTTVTASADPQAAAYSAPPSTTIVRPGDQDVVATDGQRVTVQLLAGRTTPPIGAGFVLPTSAVLPGGFVGRVVAVSPDGRTVTLEAGGIADAFDFYELSSDLSAVGPIPLQPAPTASGARAKRLALPLRLGGSLQNSINFKPVMKPKGFFRGSIVKRLGLPVGAQFDMSLAVEVGLAIDAEFKAALECGLPLAKVVIPIAATPVPIVLVVDPSIKVTASVAGKVEDFGFTVTAGFWAKGGLGVGGHGLQVGRIVGGGPTAINQTAELQLGAEMGGELTGEVVWGPTPGDRLVRQLQYPARVTSLRKHAGLELGGVQVPRHHLRLAAAVGLGLALTAGDSAAAVRGAAATPPPPPDPVVATEWVLLGATPNGRGLYVAATTNDPNCYHSVPKLLSSGSSKVRLQMDFVLNKGVEPDDLCERKEINAPARTHRVDLGRRLRGQAISGPGLVPADKVIRRFRSDVDHIRPESVVGLRARYATAILRNWGFERSQVRVSGSSSSYVIKTDPALPKRLPVGSLPDLTLFTGR